MLKRLSVADESRDFLYLALSLCFYQQLHELRPSLHLLWTEQPQTCLHRMVHINQEAQSSVHISIQQVTLVLGCT